MDHLVYTDTLTPALTFQLLDEMQERSSLYAAKSDYIPRWAKGTILAEKYATNADGNRVYLETVLICYTDTSRRSFAELRKAARLFSKTSFLDDGKKFEIRAKSGHHLLSTYDMEGWQVRKWPSCIKPHPSLVFLGDIEDDVIPIDYAALLAKAMAKRASQA